MGTEYFEKSADIRCPFCKSPLLIDMTFAAQCGFCVVECNQCKHAYLVEKDEVVRYSAKKIIEED